ncbi:23S rRNA (uracil(1939)-C(5))-methyltransferase RlmD [Anaerosphaera aminiphila]|nr:23S rRNA (uracil(1939)-C(5))-methyltransferase RlmD [Anaerosphaera aminiphila]
MKLKIIDFDYKGRGVAKYDNKTVFLDRGIIGDTVEAEIIGDKKNYYTAKVIETVDNSKDRTKSKCIYSKSCGGCDFLEYDYKKQLLWKKTKVENDLRRIGGVDSPVNDTLGMKTPYRYRNNIQLKVQDGKLGYYKKNSRELVEINECIIAKDEINNVIKILKNWNGLKSVNTVSIRENYLGEVMIVFVTSGEVKKFNTLLPNLIDSKVVAVFENKNTSGHYRFGKKFKKLYGEEFITEELLGLKFKLSPRSFFQVNHSQTEKLYNTAIDFLDLKNSDTLLDLYCGIGTITLLGAKNAGEVVGVEIVEDAIEDARENAELNNIDNVRFICGKSEEIVEKLLEDENLSFNKIILDPPRTGLNEELIETLLKIEPEKISYISCNPSTQARDLKLLSEKYSVDLVQPVDMFCNSVHIESVVGLNRKI